MPRNTEPKEANQEKQTSVSTSHNYFSGNNTPLLITIAVLLALTLLGGAFALGHQTNYSPHRPGLRMSGGMTGGMPEFGERRAGDALNSSTRLVGVVTQVNGSTFTVASNGATKDVQTNSSTQYQNGSAVKQNDSVVVFGSTNNNQFTADQVIINP